MTRAARKVGVSQPALSAMLRKLEEEVGAPLLHRTGRGVKATHAGEAFLRHAMEAIRAADSGTRAVRELLGLQTGSIRIGSGATAISALLPPVISAFRKQHPGLTFYLREAGSSAVAAALAAGELDLGIVTLPLTKQENADLLVMPLVDDELRLIVPPGHRLAPVGAAGGASVGSGGGAGGGVVAGSGRRAATAAFRWAELEGEPVVAFEAGTAVRTLIDDAARDAGVRLNVVMELRSIESIKQMVAAGIGIAFVSRFALSGWPGGPGAPCRGKALVRKLALARRRDQVPSPAAAAFERLLCESVLPKGEKGSARGHKQK